MSVVRFRRAVEDLDLLTPEQLHQLNDDILPRCHTLDDLKASLQSRDWLTPYQIEQLWKGKSGDLLLGDYLFLDRLGGGGMGKYSKPVTGAWTAWKPSRLSMRT